MWNFDLIVFLTLLYLEWMVQFELQLCLKLSKIAINIMTRMVELLYFTPLLLEKRNAG
jgi:hypothetical protein